MERVSYMKTYIQPSMTVVRLQHQSIICQSYVKSFNCAEDIDYGGGGSGDAYTKESSSVWDDEW